MAQYRHLPIYKTTYELLRHITDVTQHYPRKFRDLADMLRTETIHLVVMVYKANSFKGNRVVHLQSLLERVQVIELLMRLSKDMRFMSVKQFSTAVELTDNIGRQASGWLSHSNSGTSTA